MPLDTTSFVIWAGGTPVEYQMSLLSADYSDGGVVVDVEAERISSSPADSAGNWTLYVDGDEADSASDNGAWFRRSYTFSGPASADSAVEVEYHNPWEDVTASVSASVQSEFDPSLVDVDCSALPTDVTVGETVEVTVTVANGSTDANVDMAVEFGGVVEEESVALSGGEEAEWSAEFSPQEAGDVDPVVQVDVSGV